MSLLAPQPRPRCLPHCHPPGGHLPSHQAAETLSQPARLHLGLSQGLACPLPRPLPAGAPAPHCPAPYPSGSIPPCALSLPLLHLCLPVASGVRSPLALHSPQGPSLCLRPRLWGPMSQGFRISGLSSAHCLLPHRCLSRVLAAPASLPGPPPLPPGPGLPLHLRCSGSLPAPLASLLSASGTPLSGPACHCGEAELLAGHPGWSWGQTQRWLVSGSAVPWAPGRGVGAPKTLPCQENWGRQTWPLPAGRQQAVSRQVLQHNKTGSGWMLGPSHAGEGLDRTAST